MATNGVIHVVEDVLLPDSAKTSLLDSVKSRSKFLAEMIEKSGKITPNFHFILVLYNTHLYKVSYDFATILFKTVLLNLTIYVFMLRILLICASNGAAYATILLPIRQKN